MSAKNHKPKTAAKANKKMVKHARATVKGLPGRAKRFVANNPLRVLLGAAAAVFVMARLKHRFA